MHRAEVTALRRAALALLVVSVARWGWTTHGPSPPSVEDSVLPELLATSRDAAEESARRNEPLAAGERIDPNRASEVELDRLPGVGPATARAIVTAREDGAVFRSPEDLLAVPGIGAAKLALVRDAIVLRDPPPRRLVPRVGEGRRMVDLNHAGPEDLRSLPGVGPVIAERIVAARRERVFASVDDLARVRGIGPATIERLRPLTTTGRLP